MPSNLTKFQYCKYGTVPVHNSVIKPAHFDTNIDPTFYFNSNPDLDQTPGTVGTVPYLFESYCSFETTTRPTKILHSG